MGRKWLWFNRRPQSWTALLKTHAPCVVRWPQLEPVASRAFLFINSAVIYWAHIANMACSSSCSKEFNRKELESLLSSVLDNLDDGKVKKLSDVQGFVSFFKRARHVCVLADRAWENSHLPGCCTCCTNGEGENSAIEPTCCGCFTAKRAHIWPAWVLPKAQTESC